MGVFVLPDGTEPRVLQPCVLEFKCDGSLSWLRSVSWQDWGADETDVGHIPGRMAHWPHRLGYLQNNRTV